VTVFLVALDRTIAAEHEKAIERSLSELSEDFRRIGSTWIFKSACLPDIVRDRLVELPGLQDAVVLIFSVGALGAWSGMTEPEVGWLVDVLAEASLSMEDAIKR
jgi:hypothetical protein